MNATFIPRPLRKPPVRAFAITGAGLVGVVLAVMFVITWQSLHTWGPVTLPSSKEGLLILDRHDHPVCSIFRDRIVSPVPLSKMPAALKEAITTSEDRDFYNHHGVSVGGILRAILTNIARGHPVQGGSTISQQLIKNLYFEGERRTLSLKIKETLMAMELEQHATKEQILEAYLNYVYFGNGTYGVEEAAQEYFGKDAGKLSVAESAFIAGLVNAPSLLGSVAYRQSAMTRQREIISGMQELHFLTTPEAEAAKRQKLVFREGMSDLGHCHSYIHYALDSVKDNIAGALEKHDPMTLYTNLDVPAQVLADKTLTAGIRKAPKGVTQGALVSISVPDGAVIAMVGGVGGFEKSPWNRALSPHTAGSAFKPFVYLTGLAMGVIHPDSLVDDEPISMAVPGTNEIYSPKNFDGDYLGPISIRMAIALSRNTCAVRVGALVGADNIIKTARAAGITSRLDPTISLALGASAVSPLEMANAYATIARSGVRMQPVMVRRVESPDKKILWQPKEEAPVQVFETEPTAELIDTLQDVVAHGTGTHAQLFDRPVAGKTGTTDGARDVWFIGFTPDTVTAVWGGNDQNHAIAGRQVTGGTVMASIWQSYMRSYYKDHPTPPGEFPEPQTPLAAEPEPLQIWPEPATIYNREPKVPPQSLLPPEAAAAAKAHEKPGPIHRFFKKVFGFLE